MFASDDVVKDSGFFVRCRGLPYSAAESDIKKFFDGLSVKEVVFTNSNDGKPSGECYVEFQDHESAEKALLYDRQSMGTRYIEVFTISSSEMNKVAQRLKIKSETSGNGFVRIRGLPYSSEENDVVKFFQGFNVEEVVFGKEPGNEGRPTGEGFVRFNTSDEADRAMELNGQHMGSRYLEIFKSDGAAFEAFKDRVDKSILPLKDVAPAPLSGWYGGPPPYRYQRNDYNNYDYYGPPHGYGYEYDSRRIGKNDRVMRGGGAYGGPGGNRYSPYGGYGYNSGGRGVPPMNYRPRGYDPYENERSRINPNKVYMRGLPFRVTPSEIEQFFCSSCLC